MKSLSRDPEDCSPRASLVAQRLKRLLAMRETWVRSLGQKDSAGEGNGNPLQYSCLENPMDGGAWWAIVLRVTKTRTQLSNFTLYTYIYEKLNHCCIPETNTTL